MVLSKMNNHEHRTKQTYESYESYTFQPLRSFCTNLKPLNVSFMDDVDIQQQIILSLFEHG